MPQEDLIKALEATHATYYQELQWHKLLLDAYAGTGGFRGAVTSDASGYWGPASEAYSNSSLITPEAQVLRDTYLDRYPREDEPKYKRRIDTSHYRNTCEPIVDQKLSYLARKKHQIDGVQGNAVGAWMEDVDGMGTTAEALLRTVIRPRRAVLGWCPLMFDFSAPVPEGVSSAQAAEMGVRLNAIPLFPAHMLDWQATTMGRFEWAKVCIPRRHRPSFDAPCMRIRDFIVWYPDRVEKYTVVGDGKEAKFYDEPTVSPNPFGQVPIVSFREKPVADDPVRGVSVLWNIAPVAKRRFNVDSELDEFLRSSVFAMLQVPTEAPDKLGELIGGAGNALPIHPDSRQSYAWLTPGTDVSEVLKSRADDLDSDMWRNARMENQRGTTASATSGVSRAYEFESTNRAIADTAAAEGMDMQAALRMVAVPLGVDPSGIRVTPPTRFDVEETARDIDDATAAIALDLGPTATAEIKRAIAEKLLQNVSDEKREAIRAEIERGAALDSVNVGAVGGEPDAEDDDDGEPEEGEGEEG